MGNMRQLVGGAIHIFLSLLPPSRWDGSITNQLCFLGNLHSIAQGYQLVMSSFVLYES